MASECLMSPELLSEKMREVLEADDGDGGTNATTEPLQSKVVNFILYIFCHNFLSYFKIRKQKW